MDTVISMFKPHSRLNELAACLHREFKVHGINGALAMLYICFRCIVDAIERDLGLGWGNDRHGR